MSSVSGTAAFSAIPTFTPVVATPQNYGGNFWHYDVEDAYKDNEFLKFAAQKLQASSEEEVIRIAIMQRQSGRKENPDAFNRRARAIARLESSDFVEFLESKFKAQKQLFFNREATEKLHGFLDRTGLGQLVDKKRLDDDLKNILSRKIDSTGKNRITCNDLYQALAKQLDSYIQDPGLTISFVNGKMVANDGTKPIGSAFTLSHAIVNHWIKRVK